MIAHKNSLQERIKEFRTASEDIIICTLEVIGIPGIIDIPVKKHPELGAIPETALQLSKVRSIQSYYQIIISEFPIGNPFRSSSGKWNSMPSELGFSWRVDIIASLLTADSGRRDDEPIRYSPILA